MKLLLGTMNVGKLKEAKEIFGELFEIVELANLKNVPEIEETGKTFEENALLKAKAYYNFSGIPTVADDGGLEIDALGGEPGVKSRRWPSSTEILEGKPGREKTDAELISMTFKKLRGVPWEERTAHLRANAVFYNGEFGITIDSKVGGYIIEEKPVQCELGYPFRPIFWVPQFNKIYQDLTPEERDQLPHRRTIYRKLRDVIMKIN